MPPKADWEKCNHQKDINTWKWCWYISFFSIIIDDKNVEDKEDEKIVGKKNTATHSNQHLDNNTELVFWLWLLFYLALDEGDIKLLTTYVKSANSISIGLVLNAFIDI